MEINLYTCNLGDNLHKHIYLANDNSKAIEAIYYHCEAAVRHVHHKNYIQATKNEVNTLTVLLKAHGITKINYV